MLSWLNFSKEESPLRYVAGRIQFLYISSFLQYYIGEVSLLYTEDTSVTMNLNGAYGFSVPDYMEENVNMKAVNSSRATPE